MKLDAHGEAAYEHPTNARNEATLAAKLNARREATNEHPTITLGEATLERV